MLILLYISLRTNHEILTVLTLFILILTSASYAWGARAFSKLSVEIDLDRHRVFAGENVTIQVKIKNNKWLPVRVRVNPVFDHTAYFCDATSERSAFFLWFSESTFEWTLRTLRRGYYTLGQSLVTTSDPLVFYPRHVSFDSQINLVVFPNFYPVYPICLKERLFFGSPGSRSTVQDPVFILGTRMYQKSTPAKMIHWSASARMGSLQEKVCEPAVQAKRLVIVDAGEFRDNGGDEAFERMLETAASLVNSFERDNNAVGFLTNSAIAGSGNGFVPPGRGRQTVSTIFETLARMKNRSVSDLADLIKNSTGRLFDVQVVICCRSPETYPKEMNRLFPAKRNRPAVIVAENESGKQDRENIPGEIYTMDSICLWQ